MIDLRIIDENNFQACINYNNLRYILFSIFIEND